MVTENVQDLSKTGKSGHYTLKVARYRKGLTQRTQISVNIPCHGLYVIKACVFLEEVCQW